MSRKITIKEARRLALEILNKHCEKEDLTDAKKTNLFKNLSIGEPHFNKSGNYLTVFFSTENSYVETLEDITIFRSYETGEITGVRIHEISEIIGGI